MSSPLDPRRILILSANPKGTKPRRLDEEMREIKEGLRRSRERHEYSIDTAEAVRYRDIHRAILDYDPHIIHFSGHGAGEDGLVFEDETGQFKLVDAEAIAGLFELFSDSVECVVLNACYSEIQAKEIARHINYVIGMSQAIEDKAAIEFAVGFYDGLGAGRGYEFAHKLGCQLIRVAGIPKHLTPKLLTKDGGDANILPQPESENRPEEASVPTSATQPMTSDPNTPMQVFISYSHRDDELREEFVIHLANLRRQGKINAWHDRAIEAGEEWEAQIKSKLESAQIILLLISPPFMASDYCYDIEMQRAIERHDEGTARVIPIILRPCDWKGSPFSKLQVFPKDAKPVTEWENRDSAFLNVVQGIRQAVNTLSKK